MAKELHEMNMLDLLIERDRATRAGNDERAELISNYITALYTGGTL